MIAFVASYLIWIMVAGFAAVWLFAEDRRGKIFLGLSAVLGLIVVLILITIANKIHYDARPFVQDPTLVPLIPHAADNGFPSDHSSAAGLIAVVIALRHRWYGLLLGVAAVILAWARVAAHVHHVQDVVAGLLLGAAAAALATFVAALILNRTRILSAPPLARFLGTGAQSGDPHTRA